MFISKVENKVSSLFAKNRNTLKLLLVYIRTRVKLKILFLPSNISSFNKIQIDQLPFFVLETITCFRIR